MNNGINTQIIPHGLRASNPQQEAFVKDRLEKYIREGVASAARVAEHVMNVVPVDKVIRASHLDFDATQGGRLHFSAPETGWESRPLHRNGLGQLAGRLDIPMAYVDHLIGKGQWGLDLLAKDLREHTHRDDSRYLIRTVEGEARAVLSDKFRRIDCRPSLVALIEAAREFGAVITQGTLTDTRVQMKFIVPTIHEVYPGEWIVMGGTWSNSDFGRGASDFAHHIFRPWCWNGATGESVVRQIHIGKRLQDDVDYSPRTIELDSQATASALKDAARSALGGTRANRLLDGIRNAAETKIDGKARAEVLAKNFTKTIAADVTTAFNSPEIEQMPAGNTLWRWSNAISFVAGQLADDQADLKIDLERAAGAVLTPAMPKAAIVAGAGS